MVSFSWGCKIRGPPTPETRKWFPFSWFAVKPVQGGPPNRPHIPAKKQLNEKQATNKSNTGQKQKLPHPFPGSKQKEIRVFQGLPRFPEFQRRNSNDIQARLGPGGHLAGRQRRGGDPGHRHHGPGAAQGFVCGLRCGETGDGAAGDLGRRRRGVLLIG